ncbi:NEW3 domain-containing protein [Shewanella sp. AS16]|uniref:Ig-like domain-containing protein n=1 Tax=Shewanella sp. AS16 TaxID=2907625 RepID=UPI001F2441C0|nr:Ig-like domain-containing protein [Shewanella sp. AS16]MCE9687793.1 NEW3 domain-containing protein [Shewanella sp. AS16]
MKNVLVASRFAATHFSRLSALTLLALASATTVSGPALAKTQSHDSHAQIHLPQGKAHKARAAKARADKQQTEQQTLALAGLMAEYRHAAKAADVNGARASRDAELAQQLLELTIARQAAQSELLKTDPGAAVRSVLPESKRAGLPAEVEARLAHQGELQGELEVVYEDFEDPSLNRLHHTLVTDKGRVALHLPANARTAQLKTGDKVRVKGWQFNDGRQDAANGDLVVDEAQDGLVVLAAGADTLASTSSVSTMTPLSGTKGEQKLLVLMLNFQDNPSVQPWTAAQVQQMVFGTVNDYYREASYGQTWLTGDVKGYYTLPINTTCDYFGMDSYAQQVAKDNGIDLSQYQRLVYMLPQNSACGWRGQGTVGGVPSRAWLNGELNLLTIGHELGHNLGLKHAKELSCGSGYISDACIAITYGDVLDIMGKSEGHFNAFNKERLGWLSAEQGEIVTADKDGSFLLEPYETSSNGVAKGLKVRRGVDATTGEPLWYYLEYRQPTGFDGFLSGKADTAGVLVHLNDSAEDIESSQLLDMTPKSALNDLDDAALSVGRSYTDSVAGVTITTEWADSSGVGVNVSYSGGTGTSCVRANPALALSPNTSAWVAPGTGVSYSATVTNRDSQDCAASSFAVSAQVPAGWSATSNSLNLAPGASGSVTLTVTSSASAADGFYDINISAKNGSDSQYQSSGLVSYVVETPVAACVLANPVWSLTSNSSGAVAPGTAVTYQGMLKSNDSDSCAASTFDVAANLPTSWSADTASVSLAPGEAKAVSITVTSSSTAVDGVYDFSLLARNRNNLSYQASASANYTVSAPLPACSLAAPRITVANPVGLELAAGSLQSYSVTVTNQNSQGCDDAGFNLSASVPAGWSANSANLTLASGASKTVSLGVTSAATAISGSYSLTLTARDSVNSGYQTSTSVSYTVAAKVNSAPVAVNDSVAMSSKTSISINVLGNDSDADGDKLSISGVTQGAKGSVQIMAGGQLVYTPFKSFKSGDSFSYTVTDGQATATATVVVSLTSSGGSNGKGKR